jgi:ribosome maturation factor RimP
VLFRPLQGAFLYQPYSLAVTGAVESGGVAFAEERRQRSTEWALGPFFVCGCRFMREPEGLRALIEPTIVGLGYDLIGIDMRSASGDGFLRLYIDHPNGINLGDCESVSRHVGAVLDVEDYMSGPYRLEVSSPGLDRPLFRLTDFERFVGKPAQVRLGVPLEGRKNWKGVLRGVQGEQVLFAHEGGDVVFNFADIERARLIPEF